MRSEIERDLPKNILRLLSFLLPAFPFLHGGYWRPGSVLGPRDNGNGCDRPNFMNSSHRGRGHMICKQIIIVCNEYFEINE